MEATYKSYPSNLSDACWAYLCPYLPAAKPGGRPRSVNLRAVVDAIFYVLRSGCAWRMLPGDLPVWQTVYSYFRNWQRAGVWERINRYLREWVRRKARRRASPSAAIIDSQSVKIGSLTGNSCGFDGGKKVKGRKRHVLVDTLGLVILVVVTAANVSDKAGAEVLLKRLKGQKRLLARLLRIWADGGYRGESFMQRVYDTCGWVIEVVLRTDQTSGFQVVPKRWVVERTFGWFGWSRRLGKDYEVRPENSEAFIYLAMSNIMLRRLA
ncbi:MAG: IS5 family transposase [Cyanobacteria bacterium P01_A01_bin.135]